MACRSRRGLINSATLLGPVAIVFVVLGFATDHWVDTDVDRSHLNDIELALSNTNQEMARLYHERHRGIIRECYSDDAVFLEDAQNVNNECFFIDFDDPQGVELSREYNLRMQLMRSVLATYVLGLVGIILAFILGMVLCFARNCHVAHAASVCVFLGALCVMSSIVLFHAQEYVEANKDGKPGEIIFHNTWSKNLLKATDSELGYSYILAWVGLVLAILDGVLYILAARALRLRQLSGDDSSSESSSSSDRRAVIKKKPPPHSMKQVYDNYGMKYALPVPMYGEGIHPAYVQAMPAYPTMDLGQTYLRNGGSDFSREA